MARRGEAGQAIVVVALALVAILGILGLATDVGYMRYTKRQLQTAADAAAIAGAAELAYSDVTSAAQADSAANGFTNGTNGATVTVNNPPLSGQHIGDSNYVETIVAKTTPTFFAKAFGVKTVTLQARAVAQLGSGNNCIFALDPAASGALSVDSFASITSQCGIVVESTSGSALSCNFLASISASSIGVVGGVQSFLCSLNPTPVKGITIPNPNDPLAYLAKPAIGSCTFSSQQTYTTTNSPPSHPSTLNPGVYCGGIQVQPGASVIFNPGVYILTSGGGKGGLTIDIGTNVTTNTSLSPYGVIFYNYGPIGAITFNFTSFSSGNAVSLIAPTAGTYQGILFFQDPGNTNSAQIIGSSSYNTSLQGSYYLPKASVVFAFSGNVKYDILVADKIEFAYLTFGQGSFTGSGFSKDYTSLTTGSPVKGNGVLVE
ncbi:MAG TPA: pilus assembly protein TadG-related protein [Candidatus Acidoferrales bacterium]|nr:pilus assembly protein TadG-related protein [Candidatus Acidoferrales bacterium]